MSGHVPVLLDEVVGILKPRKGKVIVDCTVGLGGHAAALRKKGARVIGLDLDPANLARVGEGIEVHHANFAALPSVLAGATVDGILADLGVASPHFDDPARGFSYRESGPLDMRLDPSRGEPASALLARIGREDLARSGSRMRSSRGGRSGRRSTSRRRSARRRASRSGGRRGRSCTRQPGRSRRSGCW
jgi:16S rRNA (cytosine1402-N4)-methyltransferase